MAEGLLRGAVEEGELEVSSAGVSAYEGGAASEETLEILEERGLNLEGFASRMVTPEILAEATHVFCMTQGHLDVLLSLYPAEQDKFFLTCEFVELDGQVGRDVPDPIGGGKRAYEEVAAALDGAIVGIVGFVRAQANRQAESE